MENSCNPYMINIAIKLGNVRFAQYEKMFGFGAKTGVDLPGEATGIMYDEDQDSYDRCRSPIHLDRMSMFLWYKMLSRV
ncbi:MAG: penicillin-binding transpeptidase domain-containing protein [Lachnospira eligens]